MASAMEALRDGKWDNAARLGARAGEGGAELVEWFRLRAGQGSGAEVLAWDDNEAKRAAALGFTCEASFHDIIRTYIEDDLNR